MKNILKKKEGITLIALVITIIVLLLLAGVSISMLSGQDGILSKASQAKQLTNETEISDGIKQAYLTAMVKGEGKITDSLLQEALNDQFGSIKAAGSITKSGEEIKSVTIDGISVEFGESASAKQWSITTDNNNDGKADVGDLLTPTVEGLENERFYVIAISNDGTTLTLLAERCIDTSTNKQVDSGYTKVAFDSDSNIYNGSDIQGLVNAYVETLDGLDLKDVEVAYGADSVTGVKGRLMWYEEENPLKDTYNNMIYGPSTARIAYWLGSPNESSANSAWGVYGSSEGLFSGSVVNDGFFGVRPVIKILQSKV